MAMLETIECWFSFKGKEKPMLLNLTRTQIRQLKNPNTKIEATRTNREGEITVVGFNTDEVITYEYRGLIKKEGEEEETQEE